MLSLLLTTLYALDPVMGCIAGVRFVPPASLVIQPVRKIASKASQSESSSACVPCRRGLTEFPTSRFLWPAATTSAPCCPDTDSTTTTTTTTDYLTNTTGEHNWFIKQIGQYNSPCRLWSDQYQDNRRRGCCGEPVPMAVCHTEKWQQSGGVWSNSP